MFLSGQIEPKAAPRISYQAIFGLEQSGAHRVKRTVWIGETQGKGYLHEDLKAVFRRYIPRSETEAWKAEHLQIPPEKDAAGVAQSGSAYTLPAVDPRQSRLRI